MAPPDNIPSPVAWLLSWLIAATTGLVLAVLIKIAGDLTWSLKREGLDWTMDHLVRFLPDVAGLFTVEVAAIPVLAAVWALLGAGLCRFLRRFNLGMVVALGAIVPILNLFLVAGAPMRWEILVVIGLLAFVGGASAYVGIRIGRSIDHREAE